jgi:hypothetical protein
MLNHYGQGRFIHVGHTGLDLVAGVARCNATPFPPATEFDQDMLTIFEDKMSG